MAIKPHAKEYNAYYGKYIEALPDQNIMSVLEDQIKETDSILRSLTDQQAMFRYDTGKWTIKEVIGHVTDTERIMAYRLLAIARGERLSLPGYDDNSYVKEADFNRLVLADLIDQLRAVRQTTLHLIQSLPSQAWERWGKANGSDVTVRAIAYIIAGHELHHQNILIDWYLGSTSFPKC